MASASAARSHRRTVGERASKLERRTGGGVLPIQNARGTGTMIRLWRNWVDATRFAVEAQQVITLRLLRLSPGGGAAATEAQRMLTEKAAACIDAQAAATAALMSGRSLTAAARSAAGPYRRRVRANRRRLLRRT